MFKSEIFWAREEGEEEEEDEDKEEEGGGSYTVPEDQFLIKQEAIWSPLGPGSNPARFIKSWCISRRCLTCVLETAQQSGH